MLEQFRELVDWARTHHCTVRPFCTRADSRESVRYWAQRSAHASTRALLWTVRGQKPKPRTLQNYTLALEQQQALSFKFDPVIFDDPLPTQRDAERVLAAAGELLAAARMAVAETIARESSPFPPPGI